MMTETQLLTILLIFIAQERHTYEPMVNLSCGYYGKSKPVSFLTLDSSLTGTSAALLEVQGRG